MQSQELELTSNGSGAASGTISNVAGEIVGILITPGSGMSTAAVTITCDTGKVALSVTVTATTLYQTRLNAISNDGSTAITNSFIPYIAGGSVTFAIASATASKTIKAKIFFR